MHTQNINKTPVIYTRKIHIICCENMKYGIINNLMRPRLDACQQGMLFSRRLDGGEMRARHFNQFLTELKTTTLNWKLFFLQSHK